MLLKEFVAAVAVGIGLSILPLASHAFIFSPTQTQLNSVTFSDFWPGNGASLNSTTLVGTDGVEYNFNTGYALPPSTPDAFSRSQFEYAFPTTQNLSTYTAFNVDFQVPAGGSVHNNPLAAQVFLRCTGGTECLQSGGQSINTSGRSTASINLSGVPAATLTQITGFGIEFFSTPSVAGQVDMGDRVQAFTSPQPPPFVDGFLINDFEGTDLGTWGPSFQPDHAHTIVAADNTPFNNGVTKGTHALKIDRTFTGNEFPAGSGNINFRWGSEMTLNAALPAPTGDYNNNRTVDAADYTTWRDHLSQAFTLPNRDPANTGNVSAADYTSWKSHYGQTGATDPVIQNKINTLVDAINAQRTTGRLAFDVSFDNIDQFPNANPGFLGFEMFINDGAGNFYQANFGFPNLPAVGSNYKGMTLSVPISAFTDAHNPSAGSLATLALQKNSTFTIGLASNTDGNATFYIDNFRVLNRTGGSAAEVPEPASVALALVGIVCGSVGCQRRR